MWSNRLLEVVGTTRTGVHTRNNFKFELATLRSLFGQAALKVAFVTAYWATRLDVHKQIIRTVVLTMETQSVHMTEMFRRLITNICKKECRKASHGKEDDTCNAKRQESGVSQGTNAC